MYEVPIVERGDGNSKCESRRNVPVHNASTGSCFQDPQVIGRFALRPHAVEEMGSRSKANQKLSKRKRKGRANRRAKPREE